MLTEVWNFICNQVDATETLTPAIAKIVKSTHLSLYLFIDFYYWQIKGRGSQLRGELKSKARPLVEGFFGFESGLNRKIIAKNRELAENLKEEKGFVYKVVVFLLIHL
jgi:hypothetical protein